MEVEIGTSKMTAYMDPNTYKAAANGEIEIFKEMIRSQQQHLGLLLTTNENTILHINIAAQIDETNYSTDFMEQVLQLCPSILLQVNIKGETALHIAARHGHAAGVKSLLDFAKVAQACRDDHRELESGGRVQGARYEQALGLLRTKNSKNDTALHEAARYNRLAAVQLLTQEDPGFPYSANEAGETPLYLAAERGYHEVAFAILKTCICPDHRGPNGRTTLHAAIIFKHGEMTRKILEANGSLTKEADEQGWTPLHYAADTGDTSVVKQLLECDKSAAYVADKDGEMTALHVAAGQGHVGVMKELLSSCPDCFELVDNREWNVLHFAVESKNDEAVRLVLQNPLLSSLINEKDAQGNTPLHYAAASLTCISSFIHHPKVDLMACNRQNLTALDIVLATDDSSEMKKSIVEYLKKVGNRPALKDINIKEEKSESGGCNNINKEADDTKEANLIVATLIATVTFAAAFTMPGGYIEEGPGEGGALLTRNTAFRAFVIADTVAMLLSSVAVLLHISITTNKSLPNHKLFLVESYLTTIAMLGMMVAYGTGTYAVLSHSRGIAIATCVLCFCVSPIFMCGFYGFTKEDY